MILANLAVKTCCPNLKKDIPVCRFYSHDKTLFRTMRQSAVPFRGVRWAEELNTHITYVLGL